MEGIPILDYAPPTLLGIAVLMVFLGLLVPYRVVKQHLERIQFLESALAKAQEALEEEQKTGKVVRHFFEGLNDR